MQRASGVEIILDSDLSKHPLCAHGPTLLFERFTSDGKKNGKRFYACSACRDRRFCSFFLWADQFKPDRNVPFIEESKVFSTQKLKERLSIICVLPEEKRKFCPACNVLLLPEEWREHNSHGFLNTVSQDLLNYPSNLLQAKKENKTNAQYLFSPKSAQFLIDSLKKFNVENLICIGTPRIHEHVKSSNCGISSLLLDIDDRFAQFYDHFEFIKYNIFNHYFFGEKEAEKIFYQFLERPGRTVVLLDPPFGGLIDPIGLNLKEMIETRKKSKLDELDIVWIFPYFNETRITQCLPSLKMLDYQIEYQNHPSFQSKVNSNKGSPVRIFTNLDAAKFVLPSEEGYRFCEKCQRYVSKENRHCITCKSCTSKDGRPYHHCVKCNICVKSSRKHCQTCNLCLLPEHKCGSGSLVGVCHRCGQKGHKRKSCQNLDQRKKR